MRINSSSRSRYLSAGWLLLTVATGACGSLLDVEVPSRVPASTAFAPENAPILMNSVIGEFECAFGGAVISGALLGDEFANSSTGNTSWQVDRRDVTTTSTIGTGGCGGLGPFGALSVTHYLADQFRTALEGWSDTQVPDRSQYLARTAAYTGYVYLLLGETMCTATVNVGPELTKPQLFALAEERFTAAITAAQGTSVADVGNMALVGRARTRLNLGNKSGAATDARAVPVGFVKNATFSATDPRRYNPIFSINNQGIGYTVGPIYRSFRFAGVPDPRVPATDGRRLGQNGVDSLWLQGKFPSLAAPIAIAKWQEAQLIVAETELDAGNLQAAVGIINTLHAATTPPLPPFASTTASAIRAQLIYERRAEMFLESQHLYDATRFSLPFTPAVGAPFPLGGGFYSNQRCFMIPDVERNSNPNLSRGNS